MKNRKETISSQFGQKFNERLIKLSEETPK